VNGLMLTGERLIERLKLCLCLFHRNRSATRTLYAVMGNVLKVHLTFRLGLLSYIANTHTVFPRCHASSVMTQEMYRPIIELMQFTERYSSCRKEFIRQLPL